MAQHLNQEVRRDLALFGQSPGQDLGGRCVFGFGFVLRSGAARDRACGLLQMIVDPARIDVEVFENMATQRGRHPKIQPRRQLRPQVFTPEKRLLVGVDAARFLGQISHGGLGNTGVRVLQQDLDDVDVAGFNQGVGDVLAERAAHGDRQLVLLGAVPDDADQFRVAQHRALPEDRLGDLDLVVGQLDDEFVRRVGGAGQALGEVAPHHHLAVVDELAQDVGHERALALAQHLVAIVEQIADRRGQRAAAFE